QDRTVARGKRPRDLVGEVDMTGGVDQIDLVRLAVIGLVQHSDGLRLDRDSALAFEVELVEHLLDHVAGRDGAGVLEQPIGERGLPVVDVRDHRDGADQPGRRGHEGSLSVTKEKAGPTRAGLRCRVAYFFCTSGARSGASSSSSFRSRVVCGSVSAVAPIGSLPPISSRSTDGSLTIGHLPRKVSANLPYHVSASISSFRLRVFLSFATPWRRWEGSGGRRQARAGLPS